MSAASGGAPKGRILIVDGDRVSLEMMEAILELEFRVILAPSLATATQVLAEEKVDLVVLETVVGSEDGLDFLAGLREQSGIPVLLISGSGTKQTVMTALRGRASDYLDKPFSATRFLEKARELVAQGPQPCHVAARIRQFIQQHYMMKDWTVERLAQKLDLRVRTMREFFRHAYQKSPMDFLEEVRIGKARELLATTDLAIQNVAGQVGLDPNYFGRVFRRHMGRTPRQFRVEERRRMRDWDHDEGLW